MQEVRGSSPLISTNNLGHLGGLFFLLKVNTAGFFDFSWGESKKISRRRPRFRLGLPRLIENVELLVLRHGGPLVQ